MAEPHDPARSRRHRRRGSADRGADASGGRSARQQTDFRPTQLPAATAMRAREVAAPTPADLAEAADAVVLVRRPYVPPPIEQKPSGSGAVDRERR
jgi:hypothetical protein